MTVITFEEIFTRAQKEGISPKVRESLSWYQGAAKKASINAPKLIQEDPTRLKPTVNQFSIGRMYLFYYDAKHKKTLPYWDRYPLIFPVDLHKNGFYGINFHYLPPLQRARLLDALDSIKNNKKYDDTTKLKISYSLLKSVSKLRLFKPCFKLYLKAHVRSKYMYITPNEWPMCIFLPLQKFEKFGGTVTNAQVYQDSLKRAKA